MKQHEFKPHGLEPHLCGFIEGDGIKGIAVCRRLASNDIHMPAPDAQASAGEAQKCVKCGRLQGKLDTPLAYCTSDNDSYCEFAPTSSVESEAREIVELRATNERWTMNEASLLVSMGDEIAELKAMNRRWKAAVEGLTPHGSEFVNDPEACAAAIRARCDWPRQIIEAREEIARLRDALTAIAEWKSTSVPVDVVAAMKAIAQTALGKG